MTTNANRAGGVFTVATSVAVGLHCMTLTGGHVTSIDAGGALHTCYLLEHGKGRLMLESGSSVLASMKRKGLATDLPDAVLVSHYHGDHFGGIPYLYLEYTFVNERERPLQVVGPPGVEEKVRNLYGALYGSIRERELPFPVEYLEIEPGQSRELAGFSCEAFQVPHNAEPYSLGYRIESPEGSMLFSGDSAWTDDFVSKSRGTEIILCE